MSVLWATMRGGPWRATRVVLPGLTATLLAGVGCEPTAAQCGDAAPAVGVFCFPDEAVLRIGRGSAPTQIATLDVDGDGVLDVAAVNASRATLSVHWGSAGGGFQRMTSWPLGQEVAGLAHADLDGDGRVDLATALPASDAVAVLYGRGGREFLLRTHAAGKSPRGLLAARLDGDGPPALITANVGDGSVSVLRGGIVGAATKVGGGPQALAAGDLDGDGALDVAVALRDDDAVQVLRNAGGVLIAEARHAVGATPTALVAGDLDGDGKVDLASADQLGDTVSVIFGDGRGGARDSARWPVDRQPTGLVIVRGGGVLPVLGVLSEGTSSAARLDPRGGGLVSAATLGVAGAIAAADLDHDGREELVHAARTGGTIGALQAGVGLSFTPRWSGPPIGLGCALDLDGDGVDELIGRRGASDFTLIADPAVGPQAPDWPSGVGKLHSCRGVALGDDGRESLLLWGAVDADEATDEDGLVLLRREGEGWVTRFNLTFAEAVTEPIVGDVFGDGELDLVVPGNEHVWRVGGLDAGGEPEVAVLVELGLRDLAALDLDGDAALDLAATGGGQLVVFRDVGGGEAPRTWPVHRSVSAVRVGDLDGDGTDDLLLDDLRVVLAPGDPSSVITAGVEEQYTPTALVDLDDDGDLDALARVHQGDGQRVISTLENDGSGGFTPGGRHVLPGDGAWRAPVRLGDGPGLVELADDAVRVLAVGVGPVLDERAGVALDVEAPAGLADLDGDGQVDSFAGAAGAPAGLDGDGQVGSFAGAAGALAVGFGRAGGLGPTHHVSLVGQVEVGASFEHVAAGDLDGDGAAELVVLHRVLGFGDLPLTGLTVVRVAGDGEFGFVGLGSLAGWFSRGFVRDLDGDGHADLLLVGESGQSFLRGRGDGSFDPALTQGGGFPGLNAVALQTVDDDDRVDLLFYMEGGLVLARGQGNGNFDALQPWWGSFFDPRPLVADVTGDGRVDVVSQSYRGLVLFAGTGKGPGAGRVLRNVSDEYLAFATGDLDGDGVRELVAVATDYRDRPVLLRGRDAGAGFVFSEQLLVGHLGPQDELRLELRDVDGDAALDVVVVDPTGMTIVRQRP